MKSVCSQTLDNPCDILSRQSPFGMKIKLHDQQWSTEPIHQWLGYLIESLLLCEIEVHLILSAAAVDPASNGFGLVLTLNHL